MFYVKVIVISYHCFLFVIVITDKTFDKQNAR